jgi:hypothetical protein
MSGRRVVSALEAIAHAASSPDASKTAPAVESAIVEVRAARAAAPEPVAGPLGRLEDELVIWKAKLPVILKEPVGRQGMSRHARHWIEELGKLKWS